MSDKLLPCQKCGAEVRLQVQRVSFDNRKGVAQWLARRDGKQCSCLCDWAWMRWKSDKSKRSPFERKRDEWNARAKPRGEE